MTMQSTMVNGVSLAYEVRGDGEPLVLSHCGFVADAFAPLMDQPALSAYRRIRYHRRGYGSSSRISGSATILDQAADLAGLLDHLGVGPAHIAGHSISGMIAMQLAADRPDLVGSLVLMEPPLRVQSGGLVSEAVSHSVQLMAAGFQHYREGNREGALVSFLTPLFGPGFRETLERVLPGSWAQAVRDVDAFFVGDQPAIQQWQFGAAEAGRIAVPVLSVVGGESLPAATEFEHLLQAWFPQLETARVSGVNHMMQMQRPQAVAEVIAAFLARHPLR